MKRFFNKLRYIFLKRIKPEIIGGWKNSNGVYQEHTGISNMTHVSQKGDNLYIGDNVFIGAGAKIIGNVRVGHNSRIGANCVVVKDVPAHETWVGNPARKLEKKK